MSKRLPDYTVEALEALTYQSIYKDLVRESEESDRYWTALGTTTSAPLRTLVDLTRVRNDARRLLEGSGYDDGNEFAIGAAECRIAYIVGDGFQISPEPAKGQTPSPGLLAEVQDWLDAWTEMNRLDEILAETQYRNDRDGETFLRLFPGGLPEVRFVEPERVEPSGESAKGDEWGIRLDPADATKVLGYWIQPEPGADAELVAESQIVHLKANVTSASPRGWPTWEPIAKALRRSEELLVAMTASSKAQAKIALIRKIKGFTKERADQIVNKLTTPQYQHQPDGSAPRLENVEQLPYGAVVRMPFDDEIQFPSGGQSATNTVEILQANLRAAGARVNMPEWMFSGLADAKYSNAFVVEAPTLRAFNRLQSRLVWGMVEGRLKTHASLAWRAVRMAVDAGVLPREVLSQVRLKATPPSLEVRDKASETSSNVAYIQAGVKPVALVQEELGYDPADLARLAAQFPAPKPAAPAPGGGGGGPPLPNGPSPMGVTEAVTWQTAAEWAVKSKGWGLVEEDLHLEPGDELVTVARLVDWLAEGRDVSKLAKKVITNKLGHKQTVYVRQDGGTPSPKAGSPDRSGHVSKLAESTPEYEAALKEMEPLQADFDRAERAANEAHKAYEAAGKRPSKKAIDDFLAACDVAKAAKEKLRAVQDRISEMGRKELLGSFAAADGGNPVAVSKAITTQWSPTESATMATVQDFLSRLTSKAVGAVKAVTVARTKSDHDRAHYVDGHDYIFTPPETPGRIIAHEMGHHLEATVPGAKQKVQDFLAKRVGSEKPTRLAEQFPEKGFDRTETGRADDFGKLFPSSPSSAYYVGKVYPDGGTEALSMGIELLYTDPKRFAKADPEYFNLILDILQPQGGAA